MTASIPDDQILAGLQELVDAGLANWVEIDGEMGLKLTPAGVEHAEAIKRGEVAH